MDSQVSEFFTKLSNALDQLKFSSGCQTEDLKASLDNLAHRVDQLTYTVNKVEKAITKLSKNISSNSDAPINASQLASLNSQFERVTNVQTVKQTTTLQSNGQTVAEDATVYHSGQRPIQPGPAPYKPPPPPKNTLRIIQSVPHLGQDAANKKYPLHKQAMLPVFVNDSHFLTTVIPDPESTKAEPPAKTMRVDTQGVLQSVVSMPEQPTEMKRKNVTAPDNGEEHVDNSVDQDPNRTIPKPYYMANGKRRIKKLEWRDIQDLANNQGNLAPISAKVSLDKLRCKSQNIINLCYNRLATPDKKILYWKAVDVNIRREMSDQLEVFGQAVGIPLNRCEGRWASYWILYQNWRNHSDYQLKLLKNNK
jgi:hypothetical protein